MRSLVARASRTCGVLARARSACHRAAILLFSICLARVCTGNTYVVDAAIAGSRRRNTGNELAPWRTISHASAVVQPGDTVLIRTGVYREPVALKRERHRGESNPVSGGCWSNRHGHLAADRLSDWHKEAGEGNLFSTAWPHSFVDWSPHHTHPDDARHRLIGRCEQVFVQGYLLRQVLSRDRLTRGTFYADLDAKRLYAWNRRRRRPFQSRHCRRSLRSLGDLGLQRGLRPGPRHSLPLCRQPCRKVRQFFRAGTTPSKTAPSSEPTASAPHSKVKTVRCDAAHSRRTASSGLVRTALTDCC